MYGKHYYYFDKDYDQRLVGSMNMNNWDILRTDVDDESFKIEDTQELYEENCRKTISYINSANMIIKILNKRNINRIISFGCGKGILEWHIKQKSDIKVYCSDYTKKALEQLSFVFPSCDGFVLFDILNGDLSLLKEFDTALIFRVSTEFSRTDWRKVFCRLSKSNIKNIIFIPTEIADLRLIISEYKKHILNKIYGNKDIFCGYYYSLSEFKKFWFGYYEIDRLYRLGNNNGIFVLKLV